MPFCSNVNLEQCVYRVGTEAALFSCAALFTSNPVGALGGAIFGAVRSLGADTVHRFGTIFKTNREAIAFFAGLGLAVAALFAAGVPLAFANVLSLSLAGVGGGVVLHHLLPLIRPNRGY